MRHHGDLLQHWMSEDLYQDFERMLLMISSGG